MTVRYSLIGPRPPPQHDRLQTANILCQSLDPSGRSVGADHKNPTLNTLVYDVKFLDREVKEYSAKNIV